MTQKIKVKDLESLNESEITFFDKCFKFCGKYPLLFLCLWLFIYFNYEYHREFFLIYR